MFDHPDIEKYDFENVPLNQDLFLMDEVWIEEYEKSLEEMLKGGEYANVGYISHASVRSISKTSIELSWYPNLHTRFHEVRISLPRDQFIVCIDCSQHDVRPHIFVKSPWLKSIHLRSYSVFTLIDAIGVKKALKEGSLTRDRLLQLRDQIDSVADRNPDVSFISFADSLLLKSNWHVGQFDSEIEYSYEPEVFIRLIMEIQSVYREVLGLDVYAVLAQGANEYYEDPLLHISTSKNHISLNSLGLPFAQLMSIERAARQAIKDGSHGSSELYMDEHYFHSLRFAFEFDKGECGNSNYTDPLSDAECAYYHADCEKILSSLRGK